MNVSDIKHYYVFYIDSDGHIIYERTCGTLDAADRRVEDLKTYYLAAFYMLNVIPKGFKYFY